MNERQIQDGLCAYLRKNGLPFIRNRMDKKSCIREGWPDVTVVHCGRAWLCELKTPTGKLSAKQEEVIAELRASGTPTTIARSVEEAILAVSEHFGVVNADSGQPERKEVPYGPERPKSDAVTGVSSEGLWIGQLFGVDCVFQGDFTAGSTAARLRRATPADLVNIPRR